MHQKGVDQHDKTEVDFSKCLHLSSIFGHNMTDVLRQRLTSFSAFKRGTVLSKTTIFPAAISQLSMIKKKVIYPQKGHCCYFSLMTREKRIANNVGWEIPNGNNAHDSRLEETEYASG